MIVTLDANKPQENSLTPRNEFKSEILNNESSVTIKFRLRTDTPAKEITVFQVMNMDTEGIHIPSIRLSFLDIDSLYITYKDENYINHYTKVAKYTIGTLVEFEIIVKKDYIEVAYKNFKTKETLWYWRFEKRFTNYKYKCGLYSQTDEGFYTLDLVDYTMKILLGDESDNNDK